MPGPDHLIARGQPADAAITNGDQEGLGRHRGQTQHSDTGISQVDVSRVEWGHMHCPPRDIARHLGRLAKQHLHLDLDRCVAKLPVGHRQAPIVASHPQHCERTALARAQGAEVFEPLGCNRQHIALLRFIAPDLARAHARLFDMDLAQFEPRAQAGRIRKFRHRVRQPACPHVMNGENRIVCPHLPATIDHLLATTLNLRVAALHRCEIEVRRVAAGAHAGRCAAAQTNQHPRPAQLNQQGAWRKHDLVRLLRLDAAHSASDHDGLVITAHLTHHFLLESAEIPGQVGTAEFIVESRAAQRALDHDLQRRCNPVGLAVGTLPGLRGIRQIEVGDGKPGQTRLGTRSAASRALIANLAARAGGGPRKRRNRSRVVMRLHFGDQMSQLAVIAPPSGLVRVKAVDLRPLDHRRVVRIGHYCADRLRGMGLADHSKQRLVHRSRIDDPVRVEDLVTAVLGIRLRKHHQLDISRVTFDTLKMGRQIIDFVI